jgi:uncharacterized membrane protein YesL
MRKVSFNVYQTVFGVIYLGLMTNLLLVVGNLPLVVLLVTTDPAASWPFLAIAAPFGGPAIAAAFSTFAAFSAGEPNVARTFIASYRATWRRAFAVGVMVTGLLVVLLVDVRFFSDSQLGVVVIPLLGVLTALALATGLLAITAIADVPTALLRDVLRVSIYLGLRRWYLTATSMLILALFVWFFTIMPAFALGLAAAPALYLAWANSRHTLLPVLGVVDVEPAS